MNLFLRIIFIVESLFISVILGNVLISQNDIQCNSLFPTHLKKMGCYVDVM